MRRPPPLPALPPPSAPPAAQRAGPGPGGQPSPRGPGGRPPAGQSRGVPVAEVPPAARTAPALRSARGRSIPAGRGGLRTEPAPPRAPRCRSRGSRLFSLCFPKQMRHLPGGSSSSYGGSWSLRSIPWCGGFSRAAAPESPLVYDFWAGRERSGARPYPAQLPPGGCSTVPRAPASGARKR